MGVRDTTHFLLQSFSYFRCFFTLLISFELREYISDSSYMVKKNLLNFLGSFNLHIQHYRKYVVLDRIQIWWTAAHQIRRKYWYSSKLLKNIYDESSFKKNKPHRVHFIKRLECTILGLFRFILTLIRKAFFLEIYTSVWVLLRTPFWTLWKHL